MRLEYHLPTRALRPFCTAHATVTELVVPLRDLLPAMLPNLHIRVRGESSYDFGFGAVAAPRMTLIGPSTTAYQLSMYPGTELVTTGLLPAGWRALVGVPAMDLVDQVLDGEAIFGHSAVADLCDRLRETQYESDRIRLLEQFIHARLTPLNAVGRDDQAAIDHWLECSPDLSIDQLQQSLGLSARQIQRLTLDIYGSSPKALAMKYRALRAASVLTIHGRTGLVDAMTNYADQAHLTRDFRRFIGWTPITFVEERQNVAQATMIGRRKAGAVRPLSLLS